MFSFATCFVSNEPITFVVQRTLVLQVNLQMSSNEFNRLTFYPFFIGVSIPLRFVNINSHDAHAQLEVERLITPRNICGHFCGNASDDDDDIILNKPIQRL